MLWTGVAVLLGIVLLALGPVLSPFVTAAILAYVLAPSVERLCQWRWPRPLAVLVAILTAALILFAIVLILLPIIQQEIAQIRARLPGLVSTLTETTLPWLRERFNIDIHFDIGAVREWFRQHLADSGEDWAAAVLKYARSGWGAALQLLGPCSWCRSCCSTCCSTGRN
ncbi:MAG: AI-2E family transporter [Burkholderiaceae bacterium]